MNRTERFRKESGAILGLLVGGSLAGYLTGEFWTSFYISLTAILAWIIEISLKQTWLFYFAVISIIFFILIPLLNTETLPPFYFLKLAIGQMTGIVIFGVLGFILLNRKKQDG